MQKLTIRRDRTPKVLRKPAKAGTDTRISRRLLAIANALSGMSRAEAAKSAAMDRQTFIDWIIGYNEHGVAGPSDSWNGERPPMLTLDEQAELLTIVMAGPDTENDGFCAFARDDLVATGKTIGFSSRKHSCLNFRQLWSGIEAGQGRMTRLQSRFVADSWLDSTNGNHCCPQAPKYSLSTRRLRPRRVLLRAVGG